MSTAAPSAGPGSAPRSRAPFALAAAVGVGWALLLFRFESVRAEHLGLPAFDSAYFVQLVWGISHGHVFHSSFLPGNFLGLHFSPLLVAPAAAALALPGIVGLNLVTALALGAVAPTCFLACRALLPQTRAGTWLALLLSVGVLFTPPMQEAGWSAFHTEELALPLLFLATWTAVRGHRISTIGLLILVLAAKEDQAYQVAVLGVVLVALPGRAVAGRWVLGGAVATAAAVLLVVMPWFREGMTTDTAGYYSWLTTGGPSAAVAAGRLGAVATALAAPDAWRTLALTVAALGLLPLLSPRIASLALPPLLAAALSRHQPQPHMQLQYGLPLVYPLVVAAALGGARLLQWPGARARWVALLVPAAAAAVTGPLLLPMAKVLARPGASHLAGLDAAMRSVPDDAEVDADDSIAAAVASRANLHLLPHLAPAAYVLVDRSAHPPLYANASARDLAVAGVATGRRLAWSDGRIELWEPAPGN